MTSLALEARIARGPGVSVLCTQSWRLIAALEAAIARGATGIISLGIGGGLAPHLAAGDCIVASAIRSGHDVLPTDPAWARNLLDAIPDAIHAELAGSDELVMDPRAKAALHAKSGAVAVDMESHIAARVASVHRVPFAACRIVIDAAHRTLPPAAAVGLREDGTPDLRAVLRSVMRKPHQVPDLIRTARDARIAERALRVARGGLGPGLGLPGHAEIARERAVA